MGVEFERKFRATEQVLAALQAVVPGQEQYFDMQTTYYDTPDGALSSRHFTLRQRMENELSVCTLKTPEKTGGRGEFEVTCSRIEDAIPVLCKLSGVDLPSLTQKGIVPVCGARFHRIAKTFVWDGTTMELALDQGVLTGGGREIPLCEVELELKEGCRETVDAYAAGLASVFGLQPETGSKFRRALALARGD